MVQVNLTKHKVNSLTPLKDTVLVVDMAFGERRSAGGILLADDNMKDHGIRPRWAKVFAIGPEVDYLEVGQYVYVAHGRWSRGQTIVTPEGEKIVRKVDPEEILAVSDEYMSDIGIGAFTDARG